MRLRTRSGAPALPICLNAGLHYLKHAFALSDEQVVGRWVDNPYWQYFYGEEFLNHELPCHPTSLTKWRLRIGEESVNGCCR
ncbi:MAG: transposase [Methylomicrobium sp.]